jgi:MscS family membrane protein
VRGLLQPITLDLESRADLSDLRGPAARESCGGLRRMEQLQAFLARPFVEPALIMVGSLLLAYLVEALIRRTLVVLASRTTTSLDDHIIEALRRPIFLSVIFVGLGFASASFGLEDPGRFVVMAGLKTIAVFVWTVAVMQVGSLLITTVGSKRRGTSVLQPRTIPVFDMLMKILVLGAAVYFMFLAWHVDLTAWLASAGILGIALGFAAKDTLGNLFSGLSILADGSYKLGDWIVVAGTSRGELRGRVTHIGIRSTRIVTRDDVEVTLPNAMVANAQFINEMAGPYVKQRVGIPVDVAYGSDVDQVRRVLLECAANEALVEKTPVPNVRFRRFGDSGLAFELFVWIEEASERDTLIDRLNEAVYKAFAAASIEIPYAKRDVYIKELPRGLTLEPATAAEATTPAGSTAAGARGDA